MTSQGGGYVEESRDDTPPFPRPAEPQPWQQYPHAPVDPQAPVSYDYPPTYPQRVPPAGPSYGYPPPPPGYGAPPPPYYPGPYDPYLGYPAGQQQTNGLAVASLVTSIAGVLLGIPLAIFCYIGVLIPIVGAVLGGVALGQIRQTHQRGRGMAIAGLAIGATTAAITVIMIAVLAAALQSLTLLH